MILRLLEFQRQARLRCKSRNCATSVASSTVDARIVVHALAGFDNRTVAGTTTQVSRQRVIDIGACRRQVVMVKRKHRHDETGRAETALRAVVVDHALLHRVQAPSSVARDSTVNRALPSSVGRNWMQALTARNRRPSPQSSAITTVQAPQSPSAQPSLLPTRRRSSRRYCNKRSRRILQRNVDPRAIEHESATDAAPLGPSIGRVGKRRYQQGHVIMLIGLG